MCLSARQISVKTKLIFDIHLSTFTDEVAHVEGLSDLAKNYLSRKWQSWKIKSESLFLATSLVSLAFYNKTSEPG